MRVAVVGSRTITDTQKIFHVLDGMKDKITCLISGGARGVDSIAYAWAKKQGLETLILKPDWKTHGRAAGVIRNKEIIRQAEYVIAFWDGKSKGTHHSIQWAQKLHKPCFVLNI